LENPDTLKERQLETAAPAWMQEIANKNRNFGIVISGILGEDGS